MQYIDLPTLRFILYDVHQADRLVGLPRFQHHNRESFDLLLDAMRDFSDRELYPYFREMDEHPAVFRDGKITVHPQILRAMHELGDLGLIASMFDEEEGGMQLPLMLYTAAVTIMEAANNHVPGYPGLTFGAAELILKFADEHLRHTYAPRMLQGRWAGTMCLTEPQAGSSLSDITTTAYPTPDGHFLLKGQKIFISGGDYEGIDNVVHLVLARIQGAPAGTKGISLFVVPKYRPASGDAFEANDVTTAGDFAKMGQRGYCTTHLMFGEHDDCRGWLVGEANEGLRYMFQMMNGARIAVGRGAAAIATAAYYASLAYAKERPQGRRLLDGGKKDLSEGQTLIINHPDVQRMLQWQKAVAEGSLSLVFQAARYHDLHTASTDPAEKERSLLLLELLTPMVKTYPAEMGISAVSNGLQVLGGYGFCSEYILQQYYRDIRIFSIYEGTTGIQSIDLLGRKVLMENGRALRLLGEEIMAVVTAAQAFESLKPHAAQLQKSLALVQQVLGHLLPIAQRGDMERYIADATVFMDFLSTIVVGWQWLKMGVEAERQLQNDASELHSELLHTLRHYFKYHLTRAPGLAEVLCMA